MWRTRDASGRTWRSCLPALMASLSACGSSSAPPPPPGPVVQSGYAITVRPGVSDFGTGRLALAMLATVRNDAGAGPPAAWDARLYDANGTAIAPQGGYHAPGPGSYVTWTWPSVLVDAPQALELWIGPTPMDLAHVPFVASPPVSSLGVPRPRLSLDGKALSWTAVPGAATYRCLIAGQTAPLEVFSTTPSCDISTLAPGTYLVQVQALSVDLAALRANASRTPPLPDRFDVSEGRLGILVPDAGGTPLQLLAAGGALRFNGIDYIAVWASIVSPDGTPTPIPWAMSVSLVGGTVIDTATLDPYPAGTPRSFETGGYSLRARPGDYLVGATSGLTRLMVHVNVGAPAQLAEPIGVTPAGNAAGGASVTWNPVAGAASYRVRAFDLSSNEVASGWTAASQFTFPDGTFTSGQSYDVSVLATDADMIGGAAPLQVSAVETTYPTRFVAP